VHALGKLAPVRIEVARLATDVREMICRNVSPIGQNLVALDATDRDVPALQWESGLAVARKAEIGGHEPLHGMAVLTAVLVGNACELALVDVCVAVQAELILDAVLRGLAGWAMTLVAGHGDVLSQERIRALHVGCNRKRGRFPAFHAVAARAFAVVRPGEELASVYVLVAGLAEFVRNRRLEVGAMMALRATHIEVSSNQRVFRFRMIEGLFDVAQGLPIRVAMAGGAICAQRAFMRVLMTVLASGEGDAGIANAGLGSIRGRLFLMAFGAGSGAVRTGQRELCRRVVETSNFLPLRESVALRAICSRLTVVFVLVARQALYS